MAITNGRLVEEKSYNQGFTEEAIWRLVGRTDTQKGQFPLPWVVAEKLEG